MTTDKYTLTFPPEGARERELWLQHSAGFILMENVRQATIDQLDSHLSPHERQIAIDAIDAAMDQLMCVIDGVSLGLRNSTYQVDLHMLVQLQHYGTQRVESKDLRDGDGMCMGIHGWREGDYGAWPIIE